MNGRAVTGPIRAILRDEHAEMCCVQKNCGQRSRSCTDEGYFFKARPNAAYAERSSAQNYCGYSRRSIEKFKKIKKLNTKRKIRG